MAGDGAPEILHGPHDAPRPRLARLPMGALSPVADHLPCWQSPASAATREGASLMARRLKTYQTSIGFFDLAIAVPSMKAALEAWGSKANLFHQGFAKETDDPAVVAATTAKPGVILRRPVGSHGAFSEHAALPTDFALGDGRSSAGATSPPRIRRPTPAPRVSSAPPAETSAARREDARAAAAAAVDREQKRRDIERQRQEAREAAENRRRERTIAKAEAALDEARRRHTATLEEIETERSRLERRLEAEHRRWQQQRAKLEAALKATRG